MRSHRLAATVALTALLLGLLPTTGVAGPADVRLVPPAGQTAVKGGDTVTIEGTADAGATVENSVLRALDAAGATIDAYDFSGRVANDGGTLSGSFILGCGFIPGCPDDDDLRASVDAYRLELTLTGDHTHEVVSQDLEFDEVDPFIVGYFLITPDQVEVRFSEDVADPQGDTPSDWTVDGVPPVRITGEGDRRVLHTANPFSEDATPPVRYRAQTGLGATLRNEPYLDEAGNDLLARNRFSDAADRIAPDPPSIDAIDGTATSRDGDGQAVPVLGSDATPTVTIGSIEDGHTARLWLDDGDGTLEDDRDTLVAEAVASGGSAEIAWPDDLALPDDLHRLFARALDGAACDPNDSSAGTCPNASARSADALYDLDTTAPTLVDPALASTSAVTVVLSEQVTGPDTADDWTITNDDGSPGPAVTSVSGSGDSRVLRADGVLPGATLTYAATGERYADDHDNRLQDAVVAIVAQELPVVRVVDAEPVAEQDGPPSLPTFPPYTEAEATFRVELSDPPRADETVTVTLEVVPDTAAAGSDYTDPGEITVELSGDETGADVPVELIGDTLDEFDETFLLRVTSVTNAVVADDMATASITDDDPLVNLSVADATVGEGLEAELTASIDAPSGKDVSAEWSLVAGTATAGDDYEVASGTLTIPGDGETTSTTVTVATLPDDLDEADETFQLVLGEVVNANVADGTAEVTITDDDPAPSLRISDFSGFEGDATRTEQLVVTLSEASGRDVQVDWATADGTATADQDYTGDSGTVVIPAGGTSTSIDVEILGDTEGEDDETFTVQLSSPDNATIDKGTGTVTLLDDDGGVAPPPDITVSVEGGEVGEGDSMLPLLFPAEVTWTVTLSEPARGPIQIRYRTTDEGTAATGDDFEESVGTLEIPAGETSGEVTTEVIDDDLDEDDETAALQVDDPVGAVLVDDAGNPVAQLTTMATIVDDDPLTTVAFADGSEAVVVTEGRDASFTVELDQASGRDVSVEWATVFDGTASTADLPSQADEVTVLAGDTTATFVVATTDDGDEEPDETVTIELSSPTAAALAEDRPTSSRLTLADDEVPLPTITLSGGAGDEDPGALPPLTSPTPVDFMVELDEPAEDDVAVEYRTTNVADATAGSDFTGTSGTLTIPAGDTSATIEVPVLDDDLDEPDETVQLVLSDPVRARLAGGVGELPALGTILDDDPLVAVSVADAEVDEGEVAALTVTLDAASGKDVEIAYSTDDGAGSAVAGDDYASTSGTVTIPAGDTTSTFNVPTSDDADVEGDETVEVAIEVTDPDTATVDDGRAVLTILENDELPPGEDPVVSLTGAVVDEGDPSGVFVLPDTDMTFVVRLSEAATDDVQLSYETAETDPESATEGGLTDDPNSYDYVGSSGSVTIAAGDDSAEITVRVVGDAVDEFDEQFLLRLTGVSGPAHLPDGLSRTGRIADDDPLAVLGLADGSTDVGVAEGGTVELTVERTGATAKPITVDYAISFDGGASSDDAPAQSGTLELAPGQSSVSFQVDTTQDDVDEPSEAFSVVLSDPRNAALDPDADVATVTITDDDLVVPVLSVSGGSVDEGAADTFGGFGPVLVTEVDPVAPAVVEEHLVFTATLSEPAEQDVTVDWSTSDGGAATAGSDHAAASGTLTIPAGETTAEIAVDVFDDDLDEFDELLEMSFTNPRGATFPDGTSTMRESGTVADDDPLVTVALGDDIEVGEGDPATFEVTLSAVSGKDVTVRHRTTDGSATAGEDYRATDGTLAIRAGDRSGTFTIPTLDDATVEDTEGLSVDLSVVDDDTAELGRSTAALTITDDDLGDVPPGTTVVTLTGDAVDEGDPTTPLPLPLGGGGTLGFVVGLSEPADGDVVIDYETRAGTATADDDFAPTRGQVTIPDGGDETTVTVDVVPDFTDEFDEDLRLVLTGVSGDAVLPGGEIARTGRILDDDPEAQLRVSDATVLEGDVAELDVTLDNPSGKDITVDWALVDGSATAGEDYATDSGTLSFPAGTTSRTVRVATLADDHTDELIEQFELVLSDAVNAGVDDARGNVSIVDIGVDGLPTTTAVFVEDTTTTEGDADRTAVVPVRLSSASDEDTTVTWSSQRLTAADGEDYRAEGGQVVIPAGATSAQIPVTIVGDQEVEPNEDFLVLLTEAEGAVITGPTGRVTIEDDDAAGDAAGDGGTDSGGDSDGDGGGDGTGSDGVLDGAPDGERELPATGGGLGLAVIGLAALLARRRRD